MKVFTPKRTEKKSLRSCYMLIGCNFAIIVLIATLTGFILTEEYQPNKELDKICVSTHEGYDSNNTESFLGKYTKYAISCDNSYCSKVGKDIFDKKGSVVDVAIATGLCNGIMNAQSMGIGGGNFMSIYIKSENKSYMINARDVAPLNSNETMFESNPSLSSKGGLSVAIPGELAGYYEAHKMFGILKWSELFKPAIDLAENGFKLSKILASALKSSESSVRSDIGLKEIFINPSTDELFKENDLVKMPKLAKTLRIIAESGSDFEFYNGKLTQSIVDEINLNGGNVQYNDFKEFNVKIESDRFVVKLDDTNRIYTFPSPSSGMLIPYIMRIMKGYNLGNLNQMSDEEIELFYHRLIESFKYAYAKRSKFGDEEFIPMKAIYDELDNQTFIDEIRAKIDDSKTYPSSHYGGTVYKEDKGTAHISIIGPNGDAVALTSTINGYFGAKFAGKYTGIIWNNGMDDFSSPGITNNYGYRPSVENYIRPKKRPLSSMSPSIIVDNDNNVKLILGASGGSKIITAIAQVAIKALWMDFNIEEAINEYRVHHQLYPTELEFESGFSRAIQKSLILKGHKIKCFNYGGSIVQGIQTTGNLIYAYSDPRKNGAPDGL